MRASLITITFHIIMGSADAVTLSSRVHEATSRLGLQEMLVEMLPRSARPLQDIPTETHEKRPGRGYSEAALRGREASRAEKLAAAMPQESIWLLPLIALLCGGGVSSLVGAYFWSRSAGQGKVMKPEERKQETYGSTLADLYYSLPAQPRRSHTSSHAVPPNRRTTSAESEKGLLDAQEDSKLFPGPPPGAKRETLSAAVRRDTLERGIPIEDDESMSESETQSEPHGQRFPTEGQLPTSGPSIQGWTSARKHEPQRTPEAVRCSPAVLNPDESPHQSIGGGLPPPPSVWWTPRDPPKSWSDDPAQSTSAPPTAHREGQPPSDEDPSSPLAFLDTAAGALVPSTHSLRQYVARAPQGEEALQAPFHTRVDNVGGRPSAGPSPRMEPSPR
jgi:hypothetical protein